MQAQHQGARVQVVSRKELQPIANALTAVLSSWGFQTQGARVASTTQQPAQQGLAGRLKTIEQTISGAEAVSGPNLVLYAPGKEELAALIAERVAYLYYGVKPQVEQSKDLPENTDVLVELRDELRGFRDPFQTTSLQFSKTFRDRLKSGGEGPAMIAVPAGSFRMGDVQGGGDQDELPVRTVNIRKPFAIGRYEVTFDD